MPLPTRHVVPANVARKYPPRKQWQEYAEHYYQLPGGNTSAPKKPQRYSSVDGANDNSDARSYQSSVDDEKNNPNLVHSREEAANRMLANMIRQIASLSVHAHSVFETLEATTDKLTERINILNPRVDQISSNIETSKKEIELDDQENEFSVTGDISDKLANPEETSKAKKKKKNQEKVAWASKQQLDAGLFTPQSRPEALNEMYNKCDQVPAVSKMQQYREDEKDCQKLYSNPEMFFDLWKEDFINKMEEERKKRREAMKARKQARQKQKEENRRKEKTMEDMVTIVPRWKIIQKKHQEEEGTYTTQPRDSKTDKPVFEKVPIEGKKPPFETQDSFDLPLPPEDSANTDVSQTPSDINSTTGNRLSRQLSKKVLTTVGALKERQTVHDPFPQKAADDAGDTQVIESTSSGIPPPPPPPGVLPPPPPPPPTAPGLPPPKAVNTSGNSGTGGGDLMSQIAMGSTVLKKAPVQAEKPIDEREGLLGAIRQGKQLKKVTPDMMQKPEKKKDPSNAAELLAMAMDSRMGAILGESDSEEDDDSSDEWDSDNEWK